MTHHIWGEVKKRNGSPKGQKGALEAEKMEGRMI